VKLIALKDKQSILVKRGFVNKAEEEEEEEKEEKDAEGQGIQCLELVSVTTT
jgi:cytochrome oxidase assembly protein ShyY1